VTKTKLANFTSNVFNPFLISIAVISLIAIEATETWSEALKWTIIPVLLTIFPLLAIVLYLVHKGTLGNVFINVRHERNSVYILSTVWLIISAITLYKIGAPPVMIAAFVASLTCVIVFMFINLLWKISVHTAFVAASVTMLIILFGTAASIAAFLVRSQGGRGLSLKDILLPR